MQDGKRTLEGELHRAKKKKKKNQGGGINLVKEKPSLPISNQAEETEGAAVIKLSQLQSHG